MHNCQAVQVNCASIPSWDSSNFHFSLNKAGWPPHAILHYLSRPALYHQVENYNLIEPIEYRLLCGEATTTTSMLIQSHVDSREVKVQDAFNAAIRQQDSNCIVQRKATL
eukprot:TRINITY_DN67131_c2_g1_i1.p1 TRINITY_DN67131_c2_g1~~TRINITY_DN67131_c2_g1_i1.p1  ORF type:complete len:110 (+),score=5.14 TRINITY_DN67131_c2_g1_i1:106-435(+)